MYKLQLIYADKTEKKQIIDSIFYDLMYETVKKDLLPICPKCGGTGVLIKNKNFFEFSIDTITEDIDQLLDYIATVAKIPKLPENLRKIKTYLKHLLNKHSNAGKEKDLNNILQHKDLHAINTSLANFKGVQKCPDCANRHGNPVGYLKVRFPVDFLQKITRKLTAPYLLNDFNGNYINTNIHTLNLSTVPNTVKKGINVTFTNYSRKINYDTYTRPTAKQQQDITQEFTQLYTSQFIDSLIITSRILSGTMKSMLKARIEEGKINIITSRKRSIGYPEGFMYAKMYSDLNHPNARVWDKTTSTHISHFIDTAFNLTKTQIQKYVPKFEVHKKDTFKLITLFEGKLHI